MLLPSARGCLDPVTYNKGRRLGHLSQRNVLDKFPRYLLLYFIAILTGRGKGP